MLSMLFWTGCSFTSAFLVFAIVKFGKHTFYYKKINRSGIELQGGFISWNDSISIVASVGLCGYSAYKAVKAFLM